MSRDIPLDATAVASPSVRRDSLIHTARMAGERFRRARGVAVLLLAGAVSALLVAADQLVSIWAEGELMLAWLALWAVVFAAYVLFADVARQWLQQLSEAIDGRLLQYRERAADARMWAVAQSDPRVMAELDAASLRAEAAAVAAQAASPAPVVAVQATAAAEVAEEAPWTPQARSAMPRYPYFTRYY